jgi:hypothetical protein
MKLYPTGVMEGSPEELAQYQKLMQAKPEPKAPAPFPGLRVDLDSITFKPSSFPMPQWPLSGGTACTTTKGFPLLWNGWDPTATTPPTITVYANIRGQAEGQWVALPIR